jgi:hypothetical protein
MSGKFIKNDQSRRTHSAKKVGKLAEIQRRRSVSPRIHADLNLSNSNDSQQRFSQNNSSADVEMNESENDPSSDDISLLNNAVFPNNRKSENEPVRQLFEIRKVKNGKIFTFQGICSTCGQVVKMGNNSDINLRSHLAFNHDRKDLLTKGQKKVNKLLKNKDIDDRINPGEKKLVDEAVLECIYEDSRPFNDFNKPGMRKLFNVLKPGYKPMSKQTVRKRHRIK